MAAPTPVGQASTFTALWKQARWPAGSPDSRGGQFAPEGLGGGGGSPEPTVVDGIRMGKKPTPEQAKALDDYMWTNWIDVNAALRSGDATKHAEQIAALDALTDDMSDEPMMVYRRSTHALSAIRDSRGRPMNSAFLGDAEMPGFTSTSLNRDEVENFSNDAFGQKGTDILWRIRIPPRSPVIYADGKKALLGENNDLNQKEVILARGSTISVRQVIRRGPKSYEVLGVYEPPRKIRPEGWRSMFASAFP